MMLYAYLKLQRVVQYVWDCLNSVGLVNVLDRTRIHKHSVCGACMQVRCAVPTCMSGTLT